MPCRARLAAPSKSFKLVIIVHTATLNEVDGPGLVQNQRPFVAVNVGEKTKETELGDWSRQRGQWLFSEAITMELCAQDEVAISVSCSKQYNLVVANFSLTSHCVGELCFPVTAVLPRLRMEDRDAEGMVYATPIVGFDFVQSGKVMGRVFMSFETNTPPPSRKYLDGDNCCNGCDWRVDGERGLYRQQEDEGDPTTIGSSDRGFSQSGDNVQRWDTYGNRPQSGTDRSLWSNGTY